MLITDSTYKDSSCSAHMLQRPVTSVATAPAIDVKQLVRRLKQDQPDVGAVQEQLHRWAPAYRKVSCDWHRY